jgi:RNA polymerase sigma-70 factor (ECF subfamily)
MEGVPTLRPAVLKGGRMPGDSKPTITTLTEGAILAAAFERLRPRLLALIGRRVGSKLAARIDPEAVVQDAYVRAGPRWLVLSPKPDDIDVWVYRQVVDRLIELIRRTLGPEHDLNREIPCLEGNAAPLAEHLVDSQTGPETALSRAERCDVVRAALEKLDPVDREILAFRYFDGLNFAQIGAILGMRENTVNVRGLRAAVKFRRLIPHAFRPPGASLP